MPAHAVCISAHDFVATMFKRHTLIDPTQPFALPSPNAEEFLHFYRAVRMRSEGSSDCFWTRLQNWLQKNNKVPPLCNSICSQLYPQSTELTCFFCNEPAGSAGLHKASTYNIDANVRRCAVEVEDTALLAKLAAGDMIAIDTMYHHNCLCSLYNRAS